MNSFDFGEKEVINYLGFLNVNNIYHCFSSCKETDYSHSIILGVYMGWALFVETMCEKYMISMCWLHKK